MAGFPTARLRAFLRVALSYYVCGGLSAAAGLLLITTLVHAIFGPYAAAATSVGVIVVTPPDQVGPKRGKFWHLVPAALICPPLFFAVQMLHADALRLALLLVPASFLAFLGAAWGKRGLPISVSVMFAMIFSMAVPTLPPGATALSTSGYFSLGAALYLVWATAANAALNGRYRVAMLADTLLAVGALMRVQAEQYAPQRDAEAAQQLAGRLLQRQAALADQLQSARDILLESPRTSRRRQLAGILMQLLELRDHLLACQLDLDSLRAQPSQATPLLLMRAELESLARAVEDLADALLLNRLPAPFGAPGGRPGQQALSADVVVAPSADAGLALPDLLARAMVGRVGHIHDEVRRLNQLARGELEPDLEVVRATWQMFISPTAWSWRPLASLWRADAPPLRHAARAAAAIAAGQAVALAMPWGTHDYWILLTITVVLRGSLSQTLERRNARVAGTLFGCLLVGLLLYARVPAWLLVMIVSLGQGVAHGFAIRRYLVTAVAATVMALLQAHLLNAGISAGFEAAERVADTLIGAAIAWAACYVLPSWERHQLPALVRRTLVAQARHAQLALGLGPWQSLDRDAEIGWRLARREVYDSLSALVQATQRSLSEPRAVRPALEPLERLLARSYQLLAQLTAVKTMLILRRDRLDEALIRAPLADSARGIAAALAPAPDAPDSSLPQGGPLSADMALPDPLERDLSPWLLRRLQLARGLAQQVRGDAQQVVPAVAPALRPA